MLSSLLFWRNRVQDLDENFLATLTKDHNLDPDAAGTWRMVKGSAMVASKKVTLFRIFDPALLKGLVVNYKMLDSNRGAVQFEGRIGNNGFVSNINDVRAEA
jgi:hypothetical protein